MVLQIRAKLCLLNLVNATFKSLRLLLYLNELLLFYKIPIKPSSEELWTLNNLRNNFQFGIGCCMLRWVPLLHSCFPVSTNFLGLYGLCFKSSLPLLASSCYGANVGENCRFRRNELIPSLDIFLQAGFYLLFQVSLALTLCTISSFLFMQSSFSLYTGGHKKSSQFRTRCFHKSIFIQTSNPCTSPSAGWLRGGGRRGKALPQFGGVRR